MSFFAMILSNFLKTFGLTEFCKGYFRHLFNTVDNQSYVGPLPSPEYYMPETFQDFDKWYEKENKKNLIFDFQGELLQYCQSDARLLKEGCMPFKQDFERLVHLTLLTKWRLLRRATVSSVCTAFTPRLWPLNLRQDVVGDVSTNPKSLMNGWPGWNISWFHMVPTVFLMVEMVVRYVFQAPATLLTASIARPLSYMSLTGVTAVLTVTLLRLS